MESTQAVEPTAEERQQLAERVHELDQNIRTRLRVGRQTLWDVARELYEFNELSGWLVLGCESKTEWLADPEISMSSANFYKLVGVWRELVVLRKVDTDHLAELDISKVEIVLPKVQMGKVKLKDALNDAEALGARDLREKYAGSRKTLGPAVTAEEEYEVDPAPTEEQWEEISDRAKRRRQNLVKYIEAQTDWYQVGEGDGTDPEDWAVPPAEGTEEGDEGDESPETSEALSGAENGSGDRRRIDKEKVSIVRQAEKDWEALRDELISAAESGQANPRVDAKLIRAGVQGANLLIEQWRLSDEWGPGR